MFSGIITALITPFKNGKIDEKSFQDLIENQIKSGVHGLIPCGTTGESPTLSHEEHERVVKICIEVTNKRVPVIAGCGSNSTQEAIRLTKAAEDSGADGALIVAPYYNKPSQHGIYDHFKTIHDATNIPIILYNIPGRCVIDINTDTIVKLSELNNIIGIKDATGDINRVSQLKLALKGREFSQLSGDDSTALAFNAQGGNGCISVTANIFPKSTAKIQNLWNSGNFKQAIELQNKLMNIHYNLFCEPNPVAAKYAASIMGICSEELRKPLISASDENKLRIKKAVEEFIDYENNC